MEGLGFFQCSQTFLKLSPQYCPRYCRYRSWKFQVSPNLKSNPTDRQTKTFFRCFQSCMGLSTSEFQWQFSTRVTQKHQSNFFVIKNKKFVLPIILIFGYQSSIPLEFELELYLHSQKTSSMLKKVEACGKNL